VKTLIICRRRCPANLECRIGKHENWDQLCTIWQFHIIQLG